MGRVNLFDYLDERAKRKERRFRTLLEAGRPSSFLDRFPGWPTEQFLVALVIVAMFAVAYFNEADKDTRNLMVGALIAAFAGAWGYFLGSSNSAKQAGDRTDSALQLTSDALKQLPAPDPKPEADLTLKPGEKATVGAEQEIEDGD